MSIALAAVLGYLIGSLPTARAMARARGIDLLEDGSKNPGANNARRLGGYRLAIPVLLLEMVKGAVCVILGEAIGGDAGAVVGGVAAILGNVFNVWLGFRGGKGLGISAGVILALWPAALAPLVVVIAVVTALSKSTGLASLAAVVTMTGLSLVWHGEEWPTSWGVVPSFLPYFAVSAAVILIPKHLIDAIEGIKEPSRPRIR
jgi:acyl phosphate:glycerol-3-phosphate acyltransferase